MRSFFFGDPLFGVCLLCVFAVMITYATSCCVKHRGACLVNVRKNNLNSFGCVNRLLTTLSGVNNDKNTTANFTKKKQSTKYSLFEDKRGLSSCASFGRNRNEGERFRLVLGVCSRGKSTTTGADSDEEANFDNGMPAHATGDDDDDDGGSGKGEGDSVGDRNGDGDDDAPGRVPEEVLVKEEHGGSDDDHDGVGVASSTLDDEGVQSIPPPLSFTSALKPKEVVEALNDHIVGQADAKKAVAIALRNRWRRKQLRDDFKAEVRYSVLDKLCLQIMN